MFEPKDENETSLVEKQFKQRFTADTENLGGKQKFLAQTTYNNFSIVANIAWKRGNLSRCRTLILMPTIVSKFYY